MPRSPGSSWPTPSRRAAAQSSRPTGQRGSQGPVADFLAELRQQDGGTIGTAGSPSLVRSLIEQRLLDELTLMISPVVAGGGRKGRFADAAILTRFELAHAQPTSSGAIIATYRPAR